ncbi:hypothetical protein [Streptomyces sp. NPDC056883]|uniref:hypothetical protein n=1 Tax=Streptomyces sp. NPDC056883 TaxID=3345959 RepID=UPI0036882106
MHRRFKDAARKAISEDARRDAGQALFGVVQEHQVRLPSEVPHGQLHSPAQTGWVEGVSKARK